LTLHFAYDNFCRVHFQSAGSLPRWKLELRIEYGICQI